MALYKYETHVHTAESSRCGMIDAVEMVRFYKDIGYTGICITDHFLNGNTTVPEDLPWAERIELFCLGYEKAYEEGRKIGLDVFFGWEATFRGTDLLTYGLDKEWLLDNPDLLELSINEYCDRVRSAGGFIVHAHPFREASYIDMIRLLPRKVDAVEVINASRLDFENECARQYADNYDLIKIAGSDNHFGYVDRLAGIMTREPLGSIEEMVQAIRTGETEYFLDYLAEKR
ncbi:MAG: PHP domain-containing protein [Bacillota bacterium]|nr:PHP domain-containing protein [Bacillota bacterium]